MLKRDLDEIMSTLKDTIADYGYYVDFEKVYQNVDDVIVPLKLLESLVGRKDDFDAAFVNLIHKYPESLKAIPILLACRDKKMKVIDGDLKVFDFSKRKNSDDEYVKFMDRTGLKALLTEGHVTNLFDYVIGVEVGLDSNARKNRTGTTMENIVLNFLKSNPEIEYLSQAEKKQIKAEFGYSDLDSLNLTEGKNAAEKRFDYAFKVKGTDIVFLVETNFYGSGGSKLNETSRSYEKLADDVNGTKHFRFIWITDGKGWATARNNLHESYEHQQILLTLTDLANKNLINEIKKYCEELN